MPNFTGYDDNQIIGTNPDGSPIVIARNALSPEMQNNIISKIPAAQPLEAAPAEQSPDVFKQNMAQSSLKDVLFGSAVSDASDKYNMLKTLHDPNVHPEIKNSILDKMEAEDAAKKAQLTKDSEQTKRYNERAKKFGLPTINAPGAVDTPDAPQRDPQSTVPTVKTASDQVQDTPTQVPSPQNSTVGPGLQNMERGLNEQISGINKGADVAAQKGRAEAAEYSNLQNKLAPIDEARNAQAEADQKQMHTSLEAYNKAIDDHANAPEINQNRVWQNTSTPGKIAAIFSIALGGYAGGVSGRGGNVAMDQINKVIDRDLEAQKEKLDRKGKTADLRGNLLGKMKDVFDRDDTAYAAAKGVLLKNTELSLQKIAAQLAPGEAQARAQKEIGALRQSYEQNKVNYLKSVAEGIKADQGAPLNEEQIKNGLLAQDAAGSNKTFEESRNQNKSVIGDAYDKIFNKVGPLRFASREDEEQSKSAFKTAVNKGVPPTAEQSKEMDKIYFAPGTKAAASRVQAIRRLKLESQPGLRSIPSAPQVVVDPKTGRSVIVAPKSPQAIAKGN
jgi:hypothetical protein